MNQKINIATKALYATAAIHAAVTVYTMTKLYEVQTEVLALKKLHPESANSFEDVSYFSAVSFWSVILILGSVIVARELREEKPWAWVAALTIFAVASPSYALPACIIGLLSLLDARVRGVYLKKLDISI